MKQRNTLRHPTTIKRRPNERKQYHRVLLGLDHVLFLFHEASADLLVDDVRLKNQLEVIRSQVLKVESGHPFPFNAESAFAPGSTPDPDLPMGPWQTRG